MQTTEAIRRVQTSVMIDTDVRRRLRQIAADNDTKVSELINQACRQVFNLPRTPRPAA